MLSRVVQTVLAFWNDIQNTMLFYVLVKARLVPNESLEQW